MSARSARRPVPALVFLLALAVLAVVVWVRVADRDSSADAGASNCATAPQLPLNAAVTVTVLNGVGTDGLATTVLDSFTAVGFGRGNVGDAAVLPGVATVTSGPNGLAGALLVSYFLPGSTITTDTREDTSVTVTVGQKYTALAPGAVVRAAMAKALVSQSVPAPKPTPAAPGATPKTTAAKASPTATCTSTPPIPTPSSALSAASSPSS